MEPDKVHIRHCMLLFFKLDKTAKFAADQICEAWGEHSVTERTVRNWFQKFRDGNLSLEDEPRSGRPSVDIDEQLITLIDENPRQSTRTLAEELGVSNKTIDNHLHALGKVQKSDFWVPRNLTRTQMQQRLNICMFLLNKHRKKPFYSKIITGDEKWVYFENPAHQKAWIDKDETPPMTPIPQKHGKKIMLCVWWDIHGIIYWELLEKDETINAERYSTQLTRLSQNLDRMRPWKGKGPRPVYLLHDNARPHIAKMTQQTLMNLNWNVLPHPAYSPDLAPTDYHLFRSLEHSISGKTFKNAVEVRKNVGDFFDSKNEQWFRDGIHQLSDRWKTVVENEGNYFQDH
jgi:histone-lysine N-methyltransferase SETMAR